tara:strand:+ start:925 stop:1890 length:966 start_codon:yes stop_codon:yes gene_type:complete
MFLNIMNDYYKILNISTNASESEIKKQYRKMSLQYHPDKNNGDDEKFKEINEAFEILSDAQKRQTYDFQRNLNSDMNNFPINDELENLFNMFLNPKHKSRMPMRSPPIPGFPPSATKIHFFSGNLDDELSSFMNMGNNMTNNIPNKLPDDIEHKVCITMQQAYFGCNIPIEIKRIVVKSNEKYTEKETIYIDIPKGIDNNEKITIKDKGNVSNQNYSNINVFVCVENTSEFIRNGLNLIYEKKISFKESLCGFSFVIKHIDGREFKLNSKAGDVILHTQEKTIQKLGMERNDKIGNMIIRFKIILPETLSVKQISMIEEYF